LWHKRLGHPSSEVLTFLPDNLGVASDSNKGKDDVCEICLRAKQTRNSFSTSKSNTKDVFDLIHCDIWGPYCFPSLCGARYFFSIVDDDSKATWVYLMEDRTEASKLFKGLIAMVKNNLIKV